MGRSRRTIALVTALMAPPFVAGASDLPRASERVDELTLEEKALLLTGRNDWETAAIERLGIPPVWMADGPVGLRKSTGDNVTDSVPATCFPSSAAMAATWNESLVEALGAAIGAEARAEGVSLLLAPGLNLKRHPLGGRNFEYYSEDPLLSGRTAAAFVRGVQSRGVGATIKHFAVNNQEHRRMSIDARVGDRALRELYLRGFRIAVEEGRPQAVMSAYNRVNGLPASENPFLLTGVLRDEWGFEGLVVSDWGAVDDPATAVAAGLDLEMPGNPLSPSQIVAAVREGRLAEADVDRAAARVLQLADRRAALGAPGSAVDPEAHHQLARRVAVEGSVLLANRRFLPLEEGDGARLGVVGRLAAEPRIQGIGSSQVQPTRLDAPWPFVERHARAAGFEAALWAPQYGEDGLTEEEAEDLAAFLASRDRVVVFAGQRASQDAEAWDRSTIALAPADLEILEVAAASGRPFGVVLVGGGALDVGPFAADADAILMSWLGGQAFGSAVADLLFGRENPSGRLSETFPHAVADHASAIHFPGGPKAVDYGESLYVGYRYFTSFDQPVAYPFGHGLSYTNFEYANASAPPVVAELGALEVSVEVTNTGSRRGAEVVQLYARQLDPFLPRPELELVGFAKVDLAPGETRRVAIPLDPADLTYWSDLHDRWVIEPGDYEIAFGSSSADLRAVVPLRLEVGTLPPRVLTEDDILGDFLDDPQGRAVVDFVLSRAGRGPLSLAGEDDFFAAILRNLPFKKLQNFSGGALNDAAIAGLLALANSGMPPEQVTMILEQSAP